MNAKELRIGNIIDAGNNTPSPVEWIMLDGNICTSHGSGYETEFDGIPLTEEWLIKLGFRCDENGNASLDVFDYIDEEDEKNIMSISFSKERNREFEISICEDEKDYSDIINVQYIFVKNIKHVHQLQNLYFALTGEELTIK